MEIVLLYLDLFLHKYRALSDVAGHMLRASSGIKKDYFHIFSLAFRSLAF
jgi:hypothetical protein